MKSELSFEEELLPLKFTIGPSSKIYFCDFRILFFFLGEE